MYGHPEKSGYFARPGKVRKLYLDLENLGHFVNTCPESGNIP